MANLHVLLSRAATEGVLVVLYYFMNTVICVIKESGGILFLLSFDFSIHLENSA